MKTTPNLIQRRYLLIMGLATFAVSCTEAEQSSTALSSAPKTDQTEIEPSSTGALLPATSSSGMESVLEKAFPEGASLGANLAFVSKSRPEMIRFPPQTYRDRFERPHMAHFYEAIELSGKYTGSFSYLFVDGILRGMIMRFQGENVTSAQKQTIRDAVGRNLNPIESETIEVYAGGSYKTETVQFSKDDERSIAVYFHDGSEDFQLIIFDQKYFIKNDFWPPR